jgi:hypothetical protein
MTPSAPDPEVPGTLLVKIARLVVDEGTFARVIVPAVADFQQELREAADDRARRRARWHGYWTFTKLMALLFTVAPASGGTVARVPPGAGGGALLLLVTLLFASTWPFFGWFMALATAGGVLLAIAMRWWHNEHPAAVVDPIAGPKRPEINLSSIPVGGNAGGLIFAVGSVVIVILGLPELRWFTLAAVVSGVLVAGGLFAWRRAHPSALTPRNSISIR